MINLKHFLHVGRVFTGRLASFLLFPLVVAFSHLAAYSVTTTTTTHKAATDRDADCGAFLITAAFAALPPRCQRCCQRFCFWPCYLTQLIGMRMRWPLGALSSISIARWGGGGEGRED